MDKERALAVWGLGSLGIAVLSGVVGVVAAIWGYTFGLQLAASVFVVSGVSAFIAAAVTGE